MVKICQINVNRLKGKLANFHINSKDEPEIDAPADVKVYSFKGANGQNYEMHISFAYMSFSLDENGYHEIKK